MPRWIISWDCGYGNQDHKIIEEDTEAAAEEVAYNLWREAAELNADYGVKPYSKKEAVELELELELEDEDARR